LKEDLELNDLANENEKDFDAQQRKEDQAKQLGTSTDLFVRLLDWFTCLGFGRSTKEHAETVG
jgi:hypothetical protein